MITRSHRADRDHLPLGCLRSSRTCQLPAVDAPFDTDVERVFARSNNTRPHATRRVCTGILTMLEALGAEFCVTAHAICTGDDVRRYTRLHVRFDP